MNEDQIRENASQEENITEEKPIDNMEEVLTQKINAILAENDKFKRALSERIEYQKTLENRMRIEMDFAVEKILRKFLELPDDLTRAVAMTKDEAASAPINLIYNKLVSILEGLDVKIINVQPNDKFDVKYHNAISTIEGGVSGTISQVLCPAYLRNDKVIKPANVIVFR